MKKVLSMDMVFGSATRPEWSDDDETDPKSRVQQRGRGRNRNGMYTTLRFYRDDDNHDDKDNETNIYEMLTTITVM